MGNKLVRSRTKIKGRSDVTETSRSGVSKDDEEPHSSVGETKSAATPQLSPVSPESIPTRKSVFSVIVTSGTVVASSVVAL